MRKDKDKCKNKHESTIGKIIYSFLLFMPLFAIGVTCLVNTFNDSPNIDTETTIVDVPVYYQSNEVNNVSDLVINNIYYWDGDYTPNYTPSSNLELFRIKATDNLSFIQNFNNINYIRFTLSTSKNLYLYVVYNDNTWIWININTIPFNFVLDTASANFSSTSYIIDNISYTEYKLQSGTTSENVVTYVQNDIFYYAVDKVQQSPLFNWATNSIIYTGMNNFTNSLSITTPFVPLLMTYWLIISIVYFLYDIVLIILVVLHRKIHALEESI